MHAAIVNNPVYKEKRAGSRRVDRYVALAGGGRIGMVMMRTPQG